MEVQMKGPQARVLIEFCEKLVDLEPVVRLEPKTEPQRQKVSEGQNVVRQLLQATRSDILFQDLYFQGRPDQSDLGRILEGKREGSEKPPVSLREFCEKLARPEVFDCKSVNEELERLQFLEPGNRLPQTLQAMRQVRLLF